MKNKKVKKPTLQKIVTFCIFLQDYCGIDANSAATAFIQNHNLENLHQKITGNPDSAYELRK